MAIVELFSSIYEQMPLFDLRVLVAAIILTYILFKTFILDELRRIPGPWICRLTPLYIWYHAYIGDECTVIDGLFKIYGPIVRIAPNEIVIADGAALAPIHSDKGGFLKAPNYANFDFEGHATIFSALNPEHRQIRSKAVLPLFSIANIRSRIGDIESCVDKFIERLKQEATESRVASKERGDLVPVNVLNLSRSVSLDSVSTYLFGKSYGGLDERNDRMSAAGFVDSAVAIGRVFYFPNWLFRIFETFVERILPVSADIIQSLGKVDDFANGLAEKADDDDGTYQGRLLKAGITRHEVAVQCKDLMFAGTDSTGTNIAKIIWRLAKQPAVYDKLREEIDHAEKVDPNINPQAIAYLDAVIREGLRLGMANPTRFPRAVPPAGYAFTTRDGVQYFLPPGTVVGVQAYTLHLNPDVFPDPQTFKPERWTDNPTAVMQRDWFAFGQGSRQCIARNLAYTELLVTIRAVAKSNLLESAKVVTDDIEILEWFNSKVVGERIDLYWE